MTVAMELEGSLDRDGVLPNGRGGVLCVHVGETISLGTFLLPHPTGDRLPFIDGVLIGGRRGIAGNIGHIALPVEMIESLNSRPSPHDGLPPIDHRAQCDCGRSGHLQAVLGLTAVSARLDLADPADPDAALLALREAVSVGVPSARTALRQTGLGLGLVLAGVVAALDPQRITLIGPLAMHDTCDGLRESLERMNLNAAEADIYAHGDLADTIALRGAGLAVLRSAVYRGFFERAQPIGDGPTQWAGWADTTTNVEGDLVSFTPPVLTRHAVFPGES
jgi:predicted NBD/HSP70 family sugar kinase